MEHLVWFDSNYFREHDVSHNILDFLILSSLTITVKKRKRSEIEDMVK